MITSLRWINEFVDISEFLFSPQELIDILTHAGFEVGSFTDYSRKYKNLVVGEILDFSKHPNADRLKKCQVSIRRKELTIVCGASHFKRGDKVVVALPQAILKSLKTNQWVEMAPSKIRGVLSEGMLCAEEELDLGTTLLEMIQSKDKGGDILILPSGAEVGENFSTHFGFDDVILDIDITPNRSDCLSHFGMAREIASILKRSYKKKSILVSKRKTTKGSSVKKSKKKYLKNQFFEIQIKKKDLCPKYFGRVIENIQIGSSPKWLSEKLKILGFTSHNNIVDITNYVMLELGQPLHAFDLKSLKGNQITVDLSLKGEDFLALNEAHLKLTGDELTIRDQSGPIALAGVIGGKNSAVTEETSSIFLESAYFLPQSIRKSARYFGMETDSALRFSRGIDPLMVEKALDRASALIEKYAMGKVVSESLSPSFYRSKRKEIQITMDFVKNKIGIPVQSNHFIQWMKALNCEVRKKKKVKGKESILFITPPAHRFDLKEDVDLVEEYARLNGYDKILESVPKLRHFPLKHDAIYRGEEAVSDLLVGEGFFEAINLCFLNHDFQEKILGSKSDFDPMGFFYGNRESIFIKNPLNQDTHVMRKSLIPGLIKNCVFNHYHNRSYGRLFEIGRIFFKKREDREIKKENQRESMSLEEGSFIYNGTNQNRNFKELYEEIHSLGFISWNQREGLWKNDKEVPLIYELKTVLENLFHFLGFDQVDFHNEEVRFCPDFLHPSQFQSIKRKGQCIGMMGSLHPHFKKQFKLRMDVAVAEISDFRLFSQVKKFHFQEPSKFPTVERDLSFVLPDHIPASSVVSYISKKNISILKSINIFDVYKDSKLGKGKHALALKLLFQDKNRTLLEDQVLKYQEEIISDVSSQFSAQLRSQP